MPTPDHPIEPCRDLAQARPWPWLMLLLCLLCCASAQARVQLWALQGSGDTQIQTTQVTLGSPQALDLRWSQDDPAATGGQWRLARVTANGRVLQASGAVSSAPAPGKLGVFSVAASVFGALSPLQSTQFEFTVVPTFPAAHRVAAVSPPVVVTVGLDLSSLGGSGGVQFPSDAARFPALEVTRWDEHRGEPDPATNLLRTGVDLVVLARGGAQGSGAMWLSVADDNALYITSAKVSIKALGPNQTTTVPLHLDAALPPADTQLGQDAQVSAWRQRLDDACGPALRGALDWRSGAAPPLQTRSTQVLAPVGWQSFVTDIGAGSLVCKDGYCVSPCLVSKLVHQRLDHVDPGTQTGNQLLAMGHAFFTGLYPRFDSWGAARTGADLPDGPLAFTPDTQMTVASVSKLFTALATVRTLELRGKTLDEPIGAYLPSYWANDAIHSPARVYTNTITFRQLLTHTSGIKEYGSGREDDASAKRVFADLPAQSPLPCWSQVMNADQGTMFTLPINPLDHAPCYSNYNYSILRLVLPRLLGQDPEVVKPGDAFGTSLAAGQQYEALVKKLVFNPVGAGGASCQPPADNNVAWGHATTHPFWVPGVPSDPFTDPGVRFTDNRLVCGSAGWYLSVKDLARVMLSLVNGDSRILPAKVPFGPVWLSPFADMMGSHLGFDISTDQEAEKNGGWSSRCVTQKQPRQAWCGGTVMASAAVFGPRLGPRIVGLLFVNANLHGIGGHEVGPETVLQDAFRAAVHPPLPLP